MGEEFERLKRAAPKQGPKGPHVFWVSRKTRQAHLLKKLTALLDKGETVTVNGLGAAVGPTVALCAELNRRWDNGLSMVVVVGSVELTDELRPTGDNVESKIETRVNSSVRVQLKRKK